MISETKLDDSFPVHAFFYKQHFYKQRQAEIDKKQAKSTELLLFENYSLSSSTLSSKNIKEHSRKCTKNKYICLNKVI